MRLSQRNVILAWTSLWIYIPAIFSRQSLPCILLLVLSGTFSLMHWTHNKTGDWLHLADILSAFVLACSLIYQLLEAHRIFTCIFLSSGLLYFFILQRHSQKGKNIDWRRTTLYHLIFRYVGFWLAMAVHHSETNTSTWFLLTVGYVLHIFWLST